MIATIVSDTTRVLEFKAISEYTDDDNGVYIMVDTSECMRQYYNQPFLVCGYNVPSRRAIYLNDPSQMWSGDSVLKLRKATASEVVQLRNS